LRGVFVTGTGTEVGKTVVAAVIARSHATARERVAVFKPAVTGLSERTSNSTSQSRRRSSPRQHTREPDHALLRRAAGSAQSDDEIAPYRYDPPVSPHLGAELAGEHIDPARLLAAARAAADEADFLVCEGVGGLLVPLTLGYLVRDLARDLGLPLVVAALPGLGTINHTLLTIEAARAVGLDVAGVVLTPWPAEPGAVESSNREALERLGSARVQTLPPLDLTAPGTWPRLDLP
jgi:dethiobiotin synthetase